MNEGAQKTLAEYTTREFKIADLIPLHEMYDSLSDKSKCGFHPGFLGFSSIGLRWFPPQVLLLTSSIRLLKKMLVRSCPRSVFLSLITLSERNELVAFAFARLKERLPNGNFSAELGIVVSNAYQGKGFGSKLVGSLLRIAQAEKVQEMFLTVLCENLRAVRLYEGYGFRKIGKTVEDWRGKENTIFIMKKTLNSNAPTFKKKEDA
jgi:L-amino acid N-acyltransferase YncA